MKFKSILNVKDAAIMGKLRAGLKHARYGTH